MEAPNPEFLLKKQIFFGNFGLVQKCWFLGNSLDRFYGPSAMMDLCDTIEVGYGGLVTAESLESEHLQPMRMGLSIQQFCRTFANAFRSVATLESAVVEKETQQV